MSALAAIGSPSQEELDFQAKMSERMRQAMGDLMPDAVLSQIIARGIEEAFFKERVIKGRYSYDSDVKQASWMVEFLQKEVEAQAKIAVQKWIADNHDKVAAILEQTFKNGLGEAVVRAFTSMLAGPFMTLQNDINAIFNKIGRP
jgi:hypothetical protein